MVLDIYDLRTEYLDAPLGIDAERPRLSWKIRSSENNVLQAAYEIMASSDPDGQIVIWNSGRVGSDASQHVLWGGPPLSSGQRVYWKVQVEAGRFTAVSQVATFEMGLLQPSDWKAGWIEPEELVEPDVHKPVPYLRKEFDVGPGLVKARIYQSAHGLYEFWINGERGTRDIFKPGFTSYYTRTQYQAYDITPLLAQGRNCWAVALGDGWWRGKTGGITRNNFGYKVAFLGQIVLTYADGTIEVIASDTSFKTATGGLLKSDMKDGDRYDARLEPEGWKAAGFDDARWENVHAESEGHHDLRHLIASRSVPVREQETFNGVVMKTPNGETVLDFGQNIAGYVRMKLRGGKPGQMVTLVHGEALDEEGNFTQKNIKIDPKTRLQEVEYVMRGGEEEYTPLFSVFGFQYVLLKGYEGEIKPGDFTAVAVYSAMEETGTFNCSHPLINQLVSNSRWSQKGNFLDVPTDCPTRERSPWTGDSQIYVRTATDFMNVYPFFEKWLLDLNAEQFVSGKVANTIPSTISMHNPVEWKRQREKIASVTDPTTKMVMEMAMGDLENGSLADGSSGWGDTATITPYTLYLCYGDPHILENQYRSAKKWVDYIIHEAEKTNPIYADLEYSQNPEDAKYVWDTGYHWGEWLEPDVSLGEGPQAILYLYRHPQYAVATMYYFYSASLVSKMAGILGMQDDEKKYKAIAENVKRVYNKYFIQEDGTITEDRQAPNVRALAFDLVDETNRRAVASKLAQLVTENGYRLNTGFLATPYLLHVLADNGYAELAFRVLEQEQSPGWLFNVKAGATTILEDWQGFEKRIASFNHYSFGAVCDFLFAGIAGIRPDIAYPGYKHFLLKPLVGGTLTEAHASYESIYGLIQSSWKRNGDKVDYTFVVPANTTVTVMLSADETALETIQRAYPDAMYENGCIVFSIGSGKWQANGICLQAGSDGR